MSSNLFIRAGNEALRVNKPSNVDFHITQQGSDWLWAVFSIFGCLSLIYLCLFFFSEMKQQQSKLLTRYALAAPLLISLFQFFNYFLYASNLGWTPIEAEFSHISVDPKITDLDHGARQVFYAKYVVWVLSWPCLIFIQELSGISLSNASNDDEFSAMDTIHSLLVQMVGTTYWVVALLIGAMIHTTYKWGPWVFAAVIMLVIQAIQVKRLFITDKIRGLTSLVMAVAFIVVWLYFICWGLSEGGNKIQPDSEAVFYGVLDICLFAIYPAYLLIVINQYGHLPNVNLPSMKLPYHHNHNDEESDLQEAKSVEPDSARASGETQVPEQA